MNLLEMPKQNMICGCSLGLVPFWSLLECALYVHRTYIPSWLWSSLCNIFILDDRKVDWNVFVEFVVFFHIFFSFLSTSPSSKHFLVSFFLLSPLLFHICSKKCQYCDNRDRVCLPFRKSSEISLLSASATSTSTLRRMKYVKHFHFAGMC